MTQDALGNPFPPFPPTQPFPASLRSSTGHGPDFPSSAGDRELGKFRDAIVPRLTRIAVKVEGDDGLSLMDLMALLVDTQQQMAREIRLLRMGLAFARNNVCEWLEPADMDDDNEAIV